MKTNLFKMGNSLEQYRQQIGAYNTIIACKHQRKMPTNNSVNFRKIEIMMFDWFLKYF